MASYGSEFSKKNPKTQEEQYFALLPTDEIGAEIHRIEDQYRTDCKNHGLTTLWRDSYYQYYRGVYTRGQVEYEGRAGEFRSVSYNHFRNILQHILTMTTQQRPALEPMAINSDYKSTSQVKVARNLIDYYMDVKGVDEFIDRAAEHALIFGEGFLIDEWDPQIGDLVVEKKDEKTKKMVKVYEGDIVYSSASPIHVARDFGVRAYKDLEWHIVTTFHNKYSLAARYPEVKEQIEMQAYEPDDDDFFYHRKVTIATEFIPVKTLYHKKTPALPNGRIVRVADDVVLFDVPIPYDDYPVKRIAPNEIHYLPFGYSPGFDLLQMQKVKDMLESTIATNQDMFGVQNIMYPIGSSMTPENFHDGLNFIPFDPDKGAPQPINLTSTPQEVFANKKEVVTEMETITSVNATVRGDPGNNIRSGSSMALMQGLSHQFNSKYDKSYKLFVEKVGNGIINMLKSFAKEKRIIEIVGEDDSVYLEEFKADSISEIKRVIAKVANPLTKTLSGKQSIADALMERNMLKGPDQYIQVIETGRLEPLTRASQTQMDLIKRENETMLKGEKPDVSAMDNHLLHITEHTTVTASLEARADENIVKANNDHIMEHLTQLGTLPPQLLQILGQPSLQPMAMMDPNAAAAAAGGQPAQQMSDDRAVAEQPAPPVPSEVSIG